MKCGTHPASASTHTTCSRGWRSNTPPNTSVPMMSWFAADHRQERVDLAGRACRRRERVAVAVRMWNDGGSPRSTHASQNGSVARVVVVVVGRGMPGQHHPAQTERLDAPRGRRRPPRACAARSGRGRSGASGRASRTRRSSGCRPRSRRACSRGRDGCRAPCRRTGRSPRRHTVAVLFLEARHRVVPAGLQLLEAVLARRKPSCSAGRPAPATSHSGTIAAPLSISITAPIVSWSISRGARSRNAGSMRST